MKNRNTKIPPHTHTHPPISFLHSKRALLCGCHSNPKANNSPNPFLLPAKKARDENCPNQICPSKRRFSFLTPCHTLNLAPNTRPLACTVSPPSYPHPPPPLFRRGQHYKSITSWERHWADDGNEWWQMKHIGKHFLSPHCERVNALVPPRVQLAKRNLIVFLRVHVRWIRERMGIIRRKEGLVWVCCLCGFVNNN